MNMDKKLFFELSSNKGLPPVIMELDGCFEWVKNDIGEETEVGFQDYEYTLKPIYLTQEEYLNLPEAEL